MTQQDAPADLPPDNGRRPGVEPNGEVRGSGVGAGGGQVGEDMDNDAASGSDYPLTGSEGRPEKTPADLGPAHFKQ